MAASRGDYNTFTFFREKAAGGLLIMGIGFGALLELRPIRVANYLPALLIAPLIVAALTALGIPLHPP